MYLAFDAITAWRVFDLQRMGRYGPDQGTAEAVEADEFETLKVLLFNIGCRPIPRPPKLTVLEYVVVGRVAGFRPTKKTAGIQHQNTMENNNK